MTLDKSKLSRKYIDDFHNKILGWYDKYRRDLPWRAKDGEKPDPYKTWLSEIMLQQTTVQAVTPYFEKFLRLWPDVHALAKADNEQIMKEWAGLGYYARARNLHKCAQTVSNDLGGVFPKEIKSLKQLSGIGDYTAAAIRSIAYDLPAIVIDGNVDRVLARYFATETPFPKGKEEVKAYATILCDEKSLKRPADYAQALMDLGATICRPQSPLCHSCPVKDGCKAFAQKKADFYPVKGRKVERPHKQGQLFYLKDKHGRVLLEKRPPQGLLGGMVGFPTSEWELLKQKQMGVFLGLNFTKTKKTVRHVFTHFSLELEIYQNTVDDLLNLPLESHYIIKDENDVRDVGLPSLFLKAYKIMKD